MVNLKWTTVNYNEVEKAKFRLEANVFNIEAKAARKTLEDGKFNLVQLWSDNGFVKSAHYPGRFKRIYVNKGDGHPMILPSQMISLNPQPTKFISQKTTNNFDALYARLNTLLLTRSGTIGNVSLVSKSLDGIVLSDDIIRVEFKNEYELGYTYAYLKTKTGRLILETNNYGSVIQHIEPEHLQEVVIPNPDQKTKKLVHEKIMRSFELRDNSNELIQKAEEILITELKLPPIQEIESVLYNNKAGFQNFTVNFNLLDERFDGSYHIPLVNSIIDILLDNSENVLPLGHKDLSKEIILPGRFKRIYVDEGDGTVFLGGKQIHELDPVNKKYLSVKKHGDRIEKQLFLKENMIAITCSGTIGRVNLIPKHWENWTMSQHVLRVVPFSNDIAGYLYIWLNSDYGNTLIQSFTYGSVIDEIDNKQLSKLAIPILRDKSKMQTINDIALEANKLRSEAYYLEQEAIRIVNEEVIFAK